MSPGIVSHIIRLYWLRMMIWWAADCSFIQHCLQLNMAPYPFSHNVDPLTPKHYLTSRLQHKAFYKQHLLLIVSILLCISTSLILMSKRRHRSPLQVMIQQNLHLTGEKCKWSPQNDTLACFWMPKCSITCTDVRNRHCTLQTVMNYYWSTVMCKWGCTVLVSGCIYNNMSLILCCWPVLTPVWLSWQHQPRPRTPRPLFPSPRFPSPFLPSFLLPFFLLLPLSTNSRPPRLLVLSVADRFL